MNLSNRLKMVATLVDVDSRVIDVGYLAPGKSNSYNA